MKCADPVLRYVTESGKPLYRNFSHASYIVRLMHQAVFNCGKCLPCRKRKSIELAARCVLHSSLYKQNCFLTLTYNETKEGYHNEFEYSDVQKFKKRLRQDTFRKYKKRIEVFNVHEYGKNGKKHWHLIVFNHQFGDRELHTVRNGIPLFKSAELERLWPYGFASIGDVSEASAMYQAQYTQKDFKNGNVTNGKKSHSKHSGIGKPYFLRNYDQILRLGFVPFGGRKLPVPRYFEKLAKKHYCHFYDKSRFFDTKERKAEFRPFKTEEPNKKMADLYRNYLQVRQQKILELEHEWVELMSNYLTNTQDPDFVKSAQNQLYDLQKRNNQERF